MALTKCSGCGHDCSDQARFCPNCGSPVNEAPVNQAPVNEAPVNAAPAQESVPVETPVHSAPTEEVPVNPVPPAAEAPRTHTYQTNTGSRQENTGYQSNTTSYYSTYTPPEYEDKPEEGRGLAIASMVLGIVALVTLCVFIGGPIGLVGLVLGIVSLYKGNSARGFAIAGIATSGVAILLFMLMMVGIFAYS